MAEITFDDLPAAGATPITFDDIPAASHGLKFDDLPDAKPSTVSFSDLSKGGFISQPSGGINTAALGEHPADPAWLAAKGSINLGNVASHVLSKWVDNLNTATGSEEDANKDPGIVKLRQEGDSPVVSLPKPTGGSITAGATRGVEKSLEGLTTPANLAIMGALGGAPSVIHKAIGVGFGALIAKDVAEKVPVALAQPTAVGKAEGLGEAISEAVLGFGGLSKLWGRGGRLPTGTFAPTSLPEWVKEKTGHEINQENPSPASVDGLMLAKEKAGEGFFDLPKEQQAERTKIINEIDDQLKGMPPEAVKAGEERVAARWQSPPPVAEAAVPENTGGPPAKGGTSSFFKRAQAEAGVTPDVFDQIAPAEESVTTGGETTPAEPVTAETPPVPPIPPIADPAMHQAALDSAERIATQVTSGQGDIVQRAARDAAFDKIQKNIAAGKPTMSFVRETAKEAAGKAVKNTGPSLDVENDQGKTLGESTPSEELTPVQQAAKADMIDAVQKQVETLPSDIQKTAKAFLEAAQNGDKTDLRSLGEKLGVSQTTVANHLTKMRAAFKGLKEEGYSVGPGAASISEQIKNTLEPTGLKRAVVDTERLSRGAEPIPTPERQREAQVVKDAEDRLYEDPTRAKSLVARIVDDGDKSISEHDAAELLVERRKVMNERNDWEDRLGKGEDVEVAKTRLTEIENELDRLDRAQRTAGTQWGRLGHMYQRMIRDDFTLEGMERKMRAAKQGPLTDVEREQLKDQNETIKKYQSELDKLRKENEDTQLDVDTQHFVEATINELGKSYLEKPTYGKKVFDIARGIVDRWKDEAKTAHDDLRKALGTANAGIPNPAIVLHVAKILRAKIGEFGLNKAEAFAEMISEYGPKVKEHLEKGWRKKDELIAQEKGDSKAKEVASKGLRKKGEKTPVEAKAEAKAEAVAGEPLSHKVVYDYVKSLIESGIHGVDALMKAAHTGLKESFPELTERDVRRAFTEYGKAKFPSKDAVKVELAETRRVAQLQESIDRLKEGQEPLKSGLQRDKATQQVREKQKELNELLQKHAGPPSLERLASRDEAKQTALRNAIEDLDKQLRTGEKQAKGAPAPDSTKTEQLRAERDAMRAKLDEIEKEKNPGKSDVQKQEEALQKQLDEANSELAGTKEKAQPKEWKALSQKAEDLRAQLDSVRQLKKELETKPERTLEDISAEKAQKGVDAAAAALDRWDRILKGEIDREPGKAREPQSQLEEELRSEVESMRKAADEIRRNSKKGDPNFVKEQQQLKAIEKSISEYERRTKGLDFSTKGKSLGPDTEKISKAKAARDAAKKVYDDLKKAQKPVKTPEERYNATRLKQVEKRTAELEAKTKAGDFSKPTKPLPLPKIQAVKNAEFKLAQAKKKFNEGVFDTALKNRSLTRKVLEGGRDVLNTARAAMTAFDLSAVLRQGGFISLGHPIRALKAFPAMFRALASEKGEFELNKEIQSRPNADLYKSSKLHLTDPDDSHLSKMEEAYMSRWAKKIPGVSHSERAYNGFLNRLRADSFDAMADSLGHKPTPEEAKAIANFVNVATGRGNLAGAAGAAISLNTAFFAPRYVVSRFELLAGQPLYHGTAATRIAVAKEYARFLGGIGVVYALSQAAGATVEKDPRSSDFGKLKFGKLRVDPLSGLSQVSTLLARTTTGKSKTPNGIKKIRGADLPFGQEDTAAVAGRFLRSKLSPVLGAALDASSGKTVTDQPVTPAQAFERLVIPLSFGDVYDAMKDQGIAKGTALGLLSLLGWGIQKYDDHRSSSRN